MPAFTVTYSWNVQQTFDLNFTYRVVSASATTSASNYIVNEQVNGIYKPTVLYPNGGEIIRAREIEISWLEQYPPSSDGLPVSYEIFYCDNFDQVNEPDYKMIATVPSGVGKYNWRIGNTIKNNNIRIAIRGVNTRGQRSKFSLSAAPFTIEKAAPMSPIVIEPLPYSRYDSFVKFIFDDQPLIGSFSARAKYFIYFSSDYANIPTTMIAQNIPVGSGPIVWNTSNLPSAEDYKIFIYLQDDDGNRSKEVIVDNVSVLHDKYFYIDTEPPEAFIQINDGDEYTKQAETFVKVFAYDKVTNVHSIQFIEEAEPVIEGSPQRNTRDLSWTFNDIDGVKTLRLQCQDFGGNRIPVTTDVEKFRILHDAMDSIVADVIPSSNGKEIYVGINNTRGEIYKFATTTVSIDDEGKITNISTVNKSSVTFVENPIVALSFYNNDLYISVRPSANKGVCYRWTGIKLEIAFALNDDDSIINDLIQYKESLFFGTQDGGFYRFFANSISKLHQFTSSVTKLYTDRNIVFIVLKDNAKLYFFDGKNVGEIII